MKPESIISDNDHELLLRIAAGDEQAFSILHNKYNRKLYRYLLAHVKTPEVAEELMFDIFLKLWTGGNWLPKVDNFGAFLRTVARNKALDYLRVTARNTKLQTIYYKEIQNLASKPETPVHRLLDKDSLSILHSAIKQLSPQRQQVFTLHREEGYTYDEIAILLNISNHTVKRTMHDALALIRSYIKKHHTDSLAAFWLFLHL